MNAVVASDVLLSNPKRLYVLGSVLLLWLLTTLAFWVGYVGADDLFYARYAFLFHRPPINWWEFRLPVILATRASFLVFGPTEFAAAIPSLVSSLMLLGSVAWAVDWFTRPRWAATMALVLAATIPIDVGFRSVPGASSVAAAFLALGTVCVLKGKPAVRVGGSILLALGFMAHELAFFYIAIFCLTLLAFSWRQYWKPVALCVIVSVFFFVVEGTAYHVLLGDFFARFKTAAGTTTNLPMGVDPDLGISGAAFFLWPVRNIFFCKAFGVDLLLLIVAGAVAWKRLSVEHRILLTTTAMVYLWLGYGTQVPWAYKPLYRQFGYYMPLALGVASVLPFALKEAWGSRPIVVQTLVLGAVGIHVICLAGGGNWGQRVDVSRHLLRYATEHRDQVFVTDVKTMNYMYVLGGFRLPENVVCINGPEIDAHLLLNKEPPGTPRFRFPEKRIAGILVNLEELNQRTPDDAFATLLRAQRSERLRIVPVRYRLLFEPLLPFVAPRAFMIRSVGGMLVPVQS